MTGVGRFAGVENLVGAANNQDTFTVTTGGSLSGLVNGGAGGFDSLILSGGAFDRVVYTAFDAHSGTIDRDGEVPTYALQRNRRQSVGPCL
jgi:hypothetical protein